MKTRRTARRRTSTFSAVPVGLLQRKCDCGKSAGLTGNCGECQGQRLMTKPDSARRGSGAPILHELIQAKLTIGAPNDKYEQEADRVAARVMRMPDAESMPPEEKEEEEKVQMKPLAASIMPLVQRKANLDGGVQADSAIEGRLNSSMGEGSPLPEGVRSFMEPRFGADFSQVRVHTGGDAVQMNRDLQAKAFTHGSDIYYSGGNAPGNDELTAHELTHVVQQTGEMNHIAQTYVQRVHIDEKGRKKFDCPDFVGDSKLEACLNDEDRLRPFDTGNSVARIQIGLQRDGQDLGTDATRGSYGANTGKAVMAFKRKYNLGSTQFSDVGPGTTRKLDELCMRSPKPEPKPEPEPEPESSLPKKIKFWLNAFIPNTLSSAIPAPSGPFAGHTVFPGPPQPNPSHWNSCFETDDRSFSSVLGASTRVGIEADVDTGSGAITFKSIAGLTFEIDCTSGAVKCTKMPTPSISAVSIPNPFSDLQYAISGSGNDPCVFGSPDLVFRGLVTINRTARTFSFTGATTIFPAFEMYMSSGSSPVTVFTKSHRCETPFCLIPPGVDPVSGSVSI